MTFDILKKHTISEIHVMGGEIFWLDATLEDALSGKCSEAKGTSISLLNKKPDEKAYQEMPTIWIHSSYVISPAPLKEGFLRFIPTTFTAIMTYEYNTEEEKNNIIKLIEESYEG
jgi:hypothetical protein